jgi:hypothetical protein
MKQIFNYFLLALFAFILSCTGSEISKCYDYANYTEECPCASNMFRWKTSCLFKNGNEVYYSVSSQEHECLDSVLLIFNKSHFQHSFTLFKNKGYLPILIDKKDETNLYSELMGGTCINSSLPAFQIKFTKQSLLEESDEVKGVIYWWTNETSTYYDISEEVVFKRQKP